VRGDLMVCYYGCLEDGSVEDYIDEIVGVGEC
jgi:hypothetical protein